MLQIDICKGCAGCDLCYPAPRSLRTRQQIMPLAILSSGIWARMSPMTDLLALVGHPPVTCQLPGSFHSPALRAVRMAPRSFILCR